MITHNKSNRSFSQQHGSSDFEILKKIICNGFEILNCQQASAEKYALKKCKKIILSIHKRNKY